MTEAIVVAIDDVRIATNALLHERDRLREKLSVADRNISENFERITELRSLLSNGRNRNDALETERDQLRKLLMVTTQRAEAAEAKLLRVEEYAEYCIAAGGASEYFANFADWLAHQGEVQP